MANTTPRAAVPAAHPDQPANAGPKPTVGQIVHVAGDGDQSLAALITKINSDETVELTIFTPGRRAAYARARVKASRPEPISASRPDDDGVLAAWWPPRG